MLKRPKTLPNPGRIPAHNQKSQTRSLAIFSSRFTSSGELMVL